MYERGSEWRKWDLHVHTPFSHLGNSFGAVFNDYAKAFFEKAVEKQIAVVGVTDYFSIEGWKNLKQLQNDQAQLSTLVGEEIASKARRILLLPNIELRSTLLVDGRRVNYHVLFSDRLSPMEIEEDFLRDLKFNSESAPGSPDNLHSLTISNLQNLGAALKSQHSTFQDKSDICVGMMNAVIDDKDVTAVLERQATRFKRKYLFMVPADEDLSAISWNGQGHLARKLLLQKSHMLFSANRGTRDFALGKRHSHLKKFMEEFGIPKACVHGSDAHSYERMFEPDGHRYLWIKANPTFNGLLQLVNEPEDRVWIGEEPEALSHMRGNATKYLEEISIARTEYAKEGINWFSGNVQLNSGLVAIIGKKGSGKSALADIIGIAGGTSACDAMGFLDKDHFLKPKEMLGRMFKATALWNSGESSSASLDEKTKPERPERLKYIPQKHLEAICSELKQSRDTEFYRELMDVIFSHVNEEDRLEQPSLPSLIEYLTNEKQEAIHDLMAQVNEINEKIVQMSEQMLPSHRQGIENALEQRIAELKAYDNAVPTEVKDPGKDSEDQKAAEPIKRKLEELIKEWNYLDEQIERTKKESAELVRKIAAIDKLLQRIKNLQSDYDRFQQDSESDAELLGIDLRTCVKLSIDNDPISAMKDKADGRRHILQDLLNPQLEGSLLKQKEHIEKKTEEVRLSLSEPNRRYQEYLYKLAEWQKDRNAIEGTLQDPRSIVGLREALKALDTLPGQVVDLKERRALIVAQIHEAKSQLLKEYKKLYIPVQKFINEHPVSQEHGALEFTASIIEDGLGDGLLEMVHQGRKGSFQGEKEGRKRLAEIVENSDFASAEGLAAFLEEVQSHFEYDKKDGLGKPMQLREQLKDKKRPEDLLNFLYGLEYLKPHFELRWQGKLLDQLSPGERGNLLLLFYLLIDSRKVPLLIDQPEENLDNQTVATMVVPAIRHARKTRQIIMVTHNPNLAVVCDADQIIHARLDKADGNRVTYTSGAIEDETIAALVVDVLEGTKPAFDLRDTKYEILE